MHGVADDSLALLEEYDENFYGTNVDAAAAGEDDDDDSDGDDLEPPPQRLYCPELSQVASGDEQYSSEDSHASSPDPEAQMAASVEAELRDLTAAGCGCAHHNHYDELPLDALASYVTGVRQLTKPLFKQFILGQLTTGLRPAAQAAEELRFHYSVLGVRICKTMFTEIHSLGSHTLRSLQKLAGEGNPNVPAHGLQGQPPPNVLPSSLRDKVVSFIRSFAGKHGLPQPCAPRGRPGPPPIYLPASFTKTKVHGECNDALGELDSPATISYRSFLRIWKVYVRDVIIMKPRTDVCALCEWLRQNVRRARNEVDTQQAVEKLSSHITTANLEREYYKAAIASAKDTLDSADTGCTHLTFDFAQQLELPAHTRTVGPLYFKVLYRVYLFGIADEARNKQCNFLFGEQFCIGQDGKKAHGPNCVISMLHYYLEHNSPKQTLHLHADNCSGQNKNKSVLAYLMWRCATGLSDKIELSFMRVGHTRCAVDGYFGLIKQKWRKSENDTLKDVEEAVNSSCVPNTALLYCWDWREWDAFLAKTYKPVKGILKYQHFVVSKDDKINIQCRETPDGQTTLIRILQEAGNIPTDANCLPNILPPAGLSPQRLDYLDKEVGPYVSADAQPTLPWR